MENANKPIHPSASQKINETEFFEYNLPNNERQYSGLTKREHFAGLAMQCLLSNPSQIDTTDFEWLAKHAIGYADQLLKELEEE